MNYHVWEMIEEGLRKGMKSIYYIISARGVSSNNCGSKIPAIAERWQKLFQNKVQLVCSTDYTFDRLIPYMNSERKQLQSRRGGISGFHAPPWRLVVRDILTLVHEYQFYFYLRKRFKTDPPYVVWQRASRLNWATMKAAQGAGAVYVHEALDNLDKDGSPIFNWLYRILERRTIKAAHLIVVVSKIWAEMLQIEFGGPLEKYLIMYNTVDVNKYNFSQQDRIRIRNEMGFKEQDIVVGYIGSYAGYHDIKTFGRIITDSLNHQSLKNRIVWLLIGTGGGRKEIERVLAEHPNLNRVKFINWIQPQIIAEYYNALDIGILPGSVPFICPIKVLEYMAAGVAPLIPKTPANEEIVSQGFNGMLFEPGNSNSALDCILKLTNHLEELQLIRQQARNTIRDKFHPDRIIGDPMRKAIEISV